MSTAIVRRPPAYTMGGNMLDELVNRLSAGARATGAAVDAYAQQLPPGSIGKVALGADANTQMRLGRELGKGLSAIPGVSKTGAMRFAMSPAAKGVLRVVPGLSFLGAGLDVVDVLTNDTSLGKQWISRYGNWWSNWCL